MNGYNETNMTGYRNSANGNGNNGNTPDDNVVQIPTLAERDRLRREKEAAQNPVRREPVINMPPVTKWMLGLLIAVHLVQSELLSPEQSDALISTFAFTPANFTGGTFTPLLLLTPFTHMILHGSWMHLAINGFMLSAFGSGIERWLGSRRMLMLFVFSGLCGVAMHYMLNTASPFPMIGASGGISGLFAGALLMLNRGQREMGGRFGILPTALLWIGLSIGFGMLGGPDGSSIAWAAHVGGFIGGFIALKAMRV